MDHIWCFSWLSERSRNVSLISVVQSDMSSGVVASVSPIASAVTNLRPWIGGGVYMRQSLIGLHHCGAAVGRLKG